MILELVYLLFLHFVADFLLQSREMGQKKSKYFKWLYFHCSMQYMVMFIGTLFLFGFEKATAFSFLNAFMHGVVDWNIWKFYKLRVVKLCKKCKIYPSTYEYWHDPYFYATIGLDQFLHSATILGVYWILKNMMN